MPPVSCRKEVCDRQAAFRYPTYISPARRNQILRLKLPQVSKIAACLNKSRKARIRILLKDCTKRETSIEAAVSTSKTTHRSQPAQLQLRKAKKTPTSTWSTHWCDTLERSRSQLTLDWTPQPILVAPQACSWLPISATYVRLWSPRKVWRDWNTCEQRREM